MLLNDFIIIVGGYFWQEMKWQFYQIKLKMEVLGIWLHMYQAFSSYQPHCLTLYVTDYTIYLRLHFSE